MEPKIQHTLAEEARRVGLTVIDDWESDDVLSAMLKRERGSVIGRVFYLFGARSYRQVVSIQIVAAVLALTTGFTVSFGMFLMWVGLLPSSDASTVLFSIFTPIAIVAAFLSLAPETLGEQWTRLPAFFEEGQLSIKQYTDLAGHFDATVQHRSIRTSARRRYSAIKLCRGAEDVVVDLKETHVWE